MNKNKHIVFLTPGFAENEADSITIPAMQIFLKEFRKQFSGEISIITFQFPLKEKTYNWNNINVYALGGNNSKIKKIIIWRKAKQVFKQLNKEQTVTHIHSFWMGECAKVGAELASKYNLPHNCTLMGQDVLKNTYYKKIKNLPHLISLSKFHSEELSQNHQLDSQIIPWGIKLTGEKITKKTVDLIVVGSLIPLKCVNEFIETVHQIKQKHPNINCKIVGDGLLRKELEQQIKSLELTDNIELAGVLSYDKTQQIIAQSKILVHLSNFESFGMVVIEALAVNTQVIAKPVGIAKEIHEVKKVNTTNQAVDKIKELLDSENQKMTVNYSIEKTVKQYLELFDE